jgi:hypothetical protein
MSRTVIKSESRGAADYGWLKARYSFSFANYYDPDRVHFGVLRVLNDDIIEASMGFDTHPHNNMEIVTIPLEGALAHKDSLGSEKIIHQGEIQVMSAGTGIMHSEYNANSDKVTRLLQIWLFPKEKELTPRYDQKVIRDLGGDNELFTVLSPNKVSGGVWINQDAWFSMGFFNKESKVEYSSKKQGNGIYLFIIRGGAKLGDISIDARDAIAIENEEKIELTIRADSEVLLMDIPLRN